MRYQTRVVPHEDGWDFQCACGYASFGWSTQEYADLRGEQHTAEHATGEPMAELFDFRAEHGLNPARVDFIGFDDEIPGAVVSPAPEAGEE